MMLYFIGAMLIVLSVLLAATYSRLAIISEAFENLEFREVQIDDLDTDNSDGDVKSD